LLLSYKYVASYTNYEMMTYIAGG